MRKQTTSHALPSKRPNQWRPLRNLLALMLLGMFSSLGFAQTSNQPPIKNAIEKLLLVQQDGKGNAEAVEAMKTLQSATAADIPKLLLAFDSSNSISANWLRGAIVATVQRDSSLPTDSILKYLNDLSHSPAGRVVAFELLCDQDSTFAEKVVPTFVDDPSLRLRAMAIQHHIDLAKQMKDKAESVGKLGVMLGKARDFAQVTTICELLQEHGIQVDTRRQLGFLDTWKIVGVFDNKDEGGYDEPYGPEKDLTNISTTAVYTDKDGNETEWFKLETTESFGMVDLVDSIGPIKGVTAYAHTVFNAEEDADCEIRIGCVNAHKVWLNGELVIANEIYHNGITPDKFSGLAQLRKGDNVILIKVCQNEQKDNWAQRWQFQLRICDPTGKVIQPVR